ncbi:ABC transporter permease [Pyrofollis japonicus]|uniref:ABC transporter permease n=1 Tax=Pyrofollis japonicus TaxID=3060460 RepID=UPI00295AA3FE|nr:ABC transporter permease [Pyrofollis japonicus]BEP17419.1 ABC transporter permease [Pyrofollis japonicus]
MVEAITIIRERFLGSATSLLGELPPVARKLAIAGFIIVLAIVVMAVFAPFIAPYDPTKMVDTPLQPPSTKHLLGTDKLGRDVFSRIVYGGRIVLWVVALAIAISASIGIPLGLLSGYYGGRTDRALSMVMDAIYAFPSLILAIALAAVLGPSPVNAAIAISVVYIPTYFRMIRGQVLQVKATPFIESARALGLPSSRIMMKHILPHLLPTIMVVFSLSAADAVLTEAALSFLGLAVKPPTPDWGFDLYNAKAFIRSAPWLIMGPGIMITLLALGLALIGEGLGEKIRKTM